MPTLEINIHSLLQQSIVNEPGYSHLPKTVNKEGAVVSVTASEPEIEKLKADFLRAEKANNQLHFINVSNG